MNLLQLREYNISTSFRHLNSKSMVKIYAELVGDYKNYRIKSL
nr:MAG TPA: hypothetical protein [Caudoviricetes sp.]